MSFVERIIRIITVKRWAKAKKQEAEKKTITVTITKKEDDNSSSNSTYSSGGSVVAYFVGAMIAVVVAIQITFPVIDSIMTIDMGNNSTMQMGKSAKTLLNLVPLFLILSMVMVFLKPLLD